MAELNHLAIIMDGNRRWAKAHRLPPMAGHRRGYEVMKKAGDWCLKRGIKILTVFAFSTENWKRSKPEVDFLMSLLRFALTKDLKEFMKRGIRLKVLGKKEGLPKSLRQAIKNAETKTKHNKKGALNIAINYGGRLEIVEAIKKIIRKKTTAAKVSEALVNQHLWTAGESEPDLIIRTSGEQRLSGFLTWQSVYSELYFIKKHWPDFTERDLDEAIRELERRTRRFGGN